MFGRHEIDGPTKRTANDIAIDIRGMVEQQQLRSGAVQMKITPFEIIAEKEVPSENEPEKCEGQMVAETDVLLHSNLLI